MVERWMRSPGDWGKVAPLAATCCADRERQSRYQTRAPVRRRGPKQFPSLIFPHSGDISGTLHALPLLTDHAAITPVEPSGGLWSSAQVMAGYVHSELSRGMGVGSSDNPGRLRRCLLRARQFLLKTVGNG